MEIVSNPPLLGDLSRLRPDAAADAAGGEVGAASASADFSSFLNLLTAQLRNQDPLQPIDSTQFVAQLASFSTVEQLIGANTRLDRLADLATADAATAFSGWIGQEVSRIDGGFRAAGAEQAFSVPANLQADRVVASIQRADGSVLREIALPGGASQTAVWDGRDGGGAPVVDQPVFVGLSYFLGDEIVDERPAEVFRRVIGLAGTETGAVLQLSDGDRLTPDLVGSLRAAEDSAPD